MAATALPAICLRTLTGSTRAAPTVAWERSSIRVVGSASAPIHVPFCPNRDVSPATCRVTSTSLRKNARTAIPTSCITRPSSAACVALQSDLSSWRHAASLALITNTSTTRLRGARGASEDRTTTRTVSSASALPQLPSSLEKSAFPATCPSTSTSNRGSASHVLNTSSTT